MRRAASAFVFFFCAAPALAQQAPQPPFIAVSGRAYALVVADTAVLSLGVTTEKTSAADAAAQNNKTAQALVDVIKAEGIDARDVTTTSISLSPVYQSTGSADREEIIAYRATNEIEVRIRPAEKAASLAGKLIDKGANTIQGIQFIASEQGEIADRLRAEAIRNAQSEARIYVEALGLKLGRVLEIVPGVADSAAFRPRETTGFYVRGKMMPSRPVGPVPLAGGQQTIQEDVTVTWEIVQ